MTSSWLVASTKALLTASKYALVCTPACTADPNGFGDPPLAGRKTPSSAESWSMPTRCKTASAQCDLTSHLLPFVHFSSRGRQPALHPASIQARGSSPARHSAPRRPHLDQRAETFDAGKAEDCAPPLIVAAPFPGAGRPTKRPSVTTTASAPTTAPPRASRETPWPR